MTKKNIIIVALIVLGFAGMAVDYFNILGYTVADSISNIATSLLIVSALLFFVRDEVFNFWLKFAYFWIPFSALIIFTTQTTTNAWAIGGPTRETVSWIMGGLFVAISLLLITIKSWQLRKK